MDTPQRLFIFLAASVAPCLVVLWCSPHHKRQIAAKFFGSIVFIVTAAYNAYYFSPSHFDTKASLPLQVCDLLGFTAVLALLTDWHPARAVIVLCTIPFVSQAVLTPIGEQSITSARTILYWIFHWCIFSTFCYEIIVRKFRLQLSDLFMMFLVDITYVSSVGSLDMIYGWNYGYIGDTKPGVTTLVDFLGPWPLRILSMTGLALILQSLCFVAFRKRNLHYDFS